jgi:hypothetical protein
MRKSLFALVALLAASTARAETIYVEYTEVPYKPPGKGFVEFYYEGLGTGTATYGSQKIDVGGMGIGVVFRSFRESSFQPQLTFGYRSRETSGFLVQPAGDGVPPALDVTAGARLFPRKPLFSMGTVVVRPTLSANAGVDLFPGGLFISATAGFAFSFTDEPDSLLVELTYRPLSEKVTFAVPGGGEEFVKYSSSWAVRFVLSFGPGSGN